MNPLLTADPSSPTATLLGGLVSLFNDPTVVGPVSLVLGMFVKALWGRVRAYVKTTPSMTDDEFVGAIDAVVGKHFAAATKPPAPPAA